MSNLAQLVQFRGQALGQFVLIATIFGAFAMSGVIALITSHEKARLRSFLFVVLAIASLAFIFATIVSVLILPFMQSPVHLSEKALRGLLFLYTLVLCAIGLGTTLLSAGLAGVGYLVSTKVGRWTLVSAILAFGLFLFCVAYLADILR